MSKRIHISDLSPTTNLYEDHPFMIDSGTFWRCRHGETGYRPCWRCGMKHPIRFLRHWWSTK